ncbi:hypothetical protein B0H16DRAFT_551466 [Mycena metata]|uniref:Uncharacterized protein n=1 Tax=Mycena metata TaxID=1033252 RepID=A0AAD7H5M3_9AGAR|nr:hypothetical protein B0H16DRAFT_551466 [Mycena metata]
MPAACACASAAPRRVTSRHSCGAHTHLNFPPQSFHLALSNLYHPPRTHITHLLRPPLLFPLRTAFAAASRPTCYHSPTRLVGGPIALPMESSRYGTSSPALPARGIGRGRKRIPAPRTGCVIYANTRIVATIYVPVATPPARLAHAPSVSSSRSHPRATVLSIAALYTACLRLTDPPRMWWPLHTPGSARRMPSHMCTSWICVADSVAALTSTDGSLLSSTYHPLSRSTLPAAPCTCRAHTPTNLG